MAHDRLSLQTSHHRLASTGQNGHAGGDARDLTRKDGVTLSTTGMIFDVKKFSIHDGPGIRTTVFFKGCPLSCAWCHNPEGITSDRQIMYWDSRCLQCGTCMNLCSAGAIHAEAGGFVTDREICVLCGECVAVCPAGAREITGREVTVAEVMADVAKDTIFYDESGGGVTFSGGEPLLQSDFLRALLQTCHEREIHAAVDTTGFAAPAVLDRVSSLVDLFLYDLKLMDDEKHRHYTGVSNALILSNLRRLSAAGHAIVIRMPIIPGVNDGDENITRTGEFVSSLPNRHRVDILPYHNTAEDKYRRLGGVYRLPGLHAPPPERMDHIAAILCGFGLDVTIGGG
jgi:pyruvate formate lyase activating enzyme